jgi:hypothetical protein
MTAFQACIDTSTHKIDTVKFVQACEEISHVYDALFSVGMMASQLKGDILNSAGTVRKVFLKYPDKCATLQELVQFELKTIGRDKVRKDKATGIIGMLWAKRAVQFIMVLLELLVTTSNSSSQCARDTYDRVLAKYHGWVTSSLVGPLMSLVPSKPDIFAKLGLKPEEANKRTSEIVAVLRVVEAEIQRILDENDLDFPDKV